MIHLLPIKRLSIPLTDDQFLLDFELLSIKRMMKQYHSKYYIEAEWNTRGVIARIYILI